MRTLSQPPAADTPNPDEIRQLLVGTWTAVALLADAMVRTRALHRTQFHDRLLNAASLAKDQRRTSLRAVAWLVANLRRRGSHGSPPN